MYSRLKVVRQKTAGLECPHSSVVIEQRLICCWRLPSSSFKSQKFACGRCHCSFRSDCRSFGRAHFLTVRTTEGPQHCNNVAEPCRPVCALQGPHDGAAPLVQDPQTVHCCPWRCPQWNGRTRPPSARLQWHKCTSARCSCFGRAASEASSRVQLRIGSRRSGRAHSAAEAAAASGAAGYGIATDGHGCRLSPGRQHPEPAYSGGRPAGCWAKQFGIFAA